MGNRIRELREEKRMTQIRLGIELDVAQETISGYEIDRIYPGVPMLIKMSELFQASIDYILGLSDVRLPLDHGLTSVQESRLLALFRAVDHMGREKALAYLEGLQK